MNTTPNGIHAAVLHAQRLCAERGIEKLSKANMGGSTVMFRGVEAAMNELSAILVVCGITFEPRTLSLEITQLARAEPRKFTRFAITKCEFKFKHEDGSFEIAETYGEAMDFGDKAATKAQSVALRIALFNKFLVPTSATSFDTEVDTDDDGNPIDGEPVDVRDRSNSQDPPPPPPPPAPRELPSYSKEKFDTNFPAWEASIKQGANTAEDIIRKVSTVGVLSGLQKAKLNGVKRAS